MYTTHGSLKNIFKASTNNFIAGNINVEENHSYFHLK